MRNATNHSLRFSHALAVAGIVMLALLSFFCVRVATASAFEYDSSHAYVFACFEDEDSDAVRNSLDAAGYEVVVEDEEVVADAILGTPHKEYMALLDMGDTSSDEAVVTLYDLGLNLIYTDVEGYVFSDNQEMMDLGEIIVVAQQGVGTGPADVAAALDKYSSNYERIATEHDRFLMNTYLVHLNEGLDPRQVCVDLFGEPSIWRAWPNPFYGHEVGGETATYVEGVNIVKGEVLVSFDDSLSNDEILAIADQMGGYIPVVHRDRDKMDECFHNTVGGWKTYAVSLNAGVTVPEALARLNELKLEQVKQFGPDSLGYCESASNTVDCYYQVTLQGTEAEAAAALDEAGYAPSMLVSEFVDASGGIDQCYSSFLVYVGGSENQEYNVLHNIEAPSPAEIIEGLSQAKGFVSAQDARFVAGDRKELSDLHELIVTLKAGSDPAAVFGGLDAKYDVIHQFNSGSDVYLVSLDESVGPQSAIYRLLKCDEVVFAEMNPFFGHEINGVEVDWIEGITAAQGQLIARVNSGMDEGKLAEVLGAAGGVSWEQFATAGDSCCYVVALSQETTVAEAMASLKGVEGVDDAYPDMLLEVCASVNDPYVANGSQTYHSAINAPAAWDIAQCNGSVKVAVIDTGVYAEHEDLAGNVDTDAGRNYVYSGGFNNPDDVGGHGTLVAGIIAAKANNGIGTAGISYNAEIVPIRACTNSGNGAFPQTPSSRVTQAINYASGVSGVRVINCSFSLSNTTYLSDVALAMDNAATAGVLTVCAAGNTNSTSATVYPADLSSCVSVISVYDNGAHHLGVDHGQGNCISAPGVSMWTPAPGGYDGHFNYANLSGTSFAAPVVSGVAALMFAADPDLTPADAKHILFVTAKDLGTTGYDSSYGYGMVDARKALRFLTYDGRVDIWGEDYYETAAAEALAAFPNGASGAVIVCGSSWSDGMVAAGLAGAKNWPVLLVDTDSVPSATSDAIAQLGCSQILIVGGPGIVSNDTQTSLDALVSGSAGRIYGYYADDTARNVLSYGKTRGLWGDLVLVATDRSFYDALSFSPVAYAKKAPILLANTDLSDSSVNGTLDSSDWSLINTGFSKMAIAGGSAVVASSVQSSAASMYGSSSVWRLAGDSLYDTSTAIAAWATGKGWLHWDGVAFAYGMQFQDALCGSALQGKTPAPILLVENSDWGTACIPTLEVNAAGIDEVRFLGGPVPIPEALREKLIVAIL